MIRVKNIGQRTFVVKEGEIHPSKELLVSEATLAQLDACFPNEVKAIEELVKELVKESQEVVTPAEEPVTENRRKRRS